MNILDTSTSLTFTVPISAKFKRKAELFRSQQKNSFKGDKVYYNTLAVLAVDFYCQCMGIKTNLKASDSWNPIAQTLADVADLCLENIGFLECRPVLPDSDFVEVPGEVWSDRIGYLAVQFNAELTEAKILGFLPKVEEEEIPLSRWRSLEYFLERIEDSTVTKLSHWLDGIFEAGWQSLEVLAEVLKPQQQDLGWGFRKLQVPKNTLGGVKLVEIEKTGYRLALLIRIKPANEVEFDVEVELFQMGHKANLPDNLELAILDENGEMVMHAIARSTQSIQIEFSAEYNEIFQVKLSLGDTTITELFQV